jgi:cardiolipin synthase
MVSWLGGHNIGDEYLGKDPKFGDWRDTHIRIEGPATMAVQLSFVEDWRWACGDTLSHLQWIPCVHPEGGKSVLVVPSGPADKLETTNLMFLHVINNANRRLWITSPYFVPDSGIIAALQLAALRGVDVRIMVPEKPDNKMVGFAFYAYFDDVNMAGVKVYQYTAGFLHQKVVLVDDYVSVVGTANFDNRSFRLNFEISALVVGAEFNKEVENMLEDDFQHCYQMQDDAFTSKHLLFRIGARMSRLAAPIL